MSDRPLGEGYWQAADGLWYRQEQHPDWRPPPPPQAWPSGKPTNWVKPVLIGALVVVILGGIGTGLAFGLGGSKKKPAAVRQRVTVEFTVTSGDWDHPGLGDGDDCEGDDVTGGFSDINSLTPVEVSTINGKVLARTELGQGSTETQPDPIDPDNEFSAWKCQYDPRLTITKGADGGQGFVISVGHRGTIQKSWRQLAGGEIGLTLTAS